MRTIDEVITFIRTAIQELTTTDITCCRFHLDNDVNLYMGWSEMYPEGIPDVIYSKEEPSWALVAGIKFNDDMLWADFDALLSPAKDMELLENYSPIVHDIFVPAYSADEDATTIWKDAVYFLEGYEQIKEELQRVRETN